MRRFLPKQALALILTAFLTAFAANTPAFAGDVQDAFDNLLNTQGAATWDGPGQYSSQARNAFMAGGGEVRFPSTRTPALYSISTPRMDAGCGGISMHFGGFSFVSGDEIKQLIENIMQNALGFAIELVLTTLNPQIAHVMDVMRALAREAANTSINSCEVARGLLSRASTEVFGYTPDDRENRRDTCAQLTTDTNQARDWVQAMGASMCAGIQRVSGLIEQATENKFDQNNDPNKSQEDLDRALCGNDVDCNQLWMLLNDTALRTTVAGGNITDATTSAKIRAKLILMNVMGTRVACGSTAMCEAQAAAGNGGGAQPELGSVFFPPTLGNITTAGEAGSMNDVFLLFMCGSERPNLQAGQNTWQEYCKDENVSRAQGAIAERFVWDCEGSNGTVGGDGYDKCKNLVYVPLRTSGLVGEGYLSLVIDTLYRGVDAVRTNQPMPADVINLIQAMPVPLYQAINAAAVYPDAGENLLTSMSVQVAELLTYAHVRDMIRSAELFQKTVRYRPDTFDRLYRFLGAMRSISYNRQTQVLQAMAMQTALMEQIRLLNIAMQRDVMSEELLGAQNYGTAVNTAAQQAAGGNP